MTKEFQPYADAWQHVWNSHRNIFCPKAANGTWFCPQKNDVPVFSQNKYREGNAGQYRWFVPQNLSGLVAAWNSSDAYAEALNTFFIKGFANDTDQQNGTPNDFFWAGNEPDMMTPFQFPAAGNRYAWLTDLWVAATLAKYYQPSPSFAGLPGNDDFGALSAFEFFAMSGLYPVASTNSYILATPWFASSTWYVSADAASFSPFPGAKGSEGKVLRITVQNHPGTEAVWQAAKSLLTNTKGSNSKRNISREYYYIQTATLNGRPLADRSFTHEQMLAGVAPGGVVSLDITLASEPVVFGQATPQAGGPSPFYPVN